MPVNIRCVGKKKAIISKPNITLLKKKVRIIKIHDPHSMNFRENLFMVPNTALI